MGIELVPLCTIDIELRGAVDIGSGPAGWRMIIEVASATVLGDRLRGRFRGGAAADWLLINGTTGTLDVRATIETHDGVLVYTHYTGRVDMTGGPGAAPIHVAPVFETGDPRYAWLNTVQAIGKGTLTGNRLTYEWYEVR